MKTIPVNKIYQYQELKKKEQEASVQIGIASRMTDKTVTKLEWPVKNPQFNNENNNDGPWGDPPEYMTQTLITGISAEIKEAVIQLLEKKRQDITQQIDDICITIEDK